MSDDRDSIFNYMPHVYAMMNPQMMLTYYGHTPDWWHKHVEWYNRMHADDPNFMPVSEVMIDAFFTMGGAPKGFEHELLKVWEWWSDRPGLDDFLCGS